MSCVDGALEYARIRAEMQAQAEAEARAERDAKADREHAIAQAAREEERRRCLAWVRWGCGLQWCTPDAEEEAIVEGIESGNNVSCWQVQRLEAL